MKRLLKPDGVMVVTLDLFLDLKPFTPRDTNKWGRNLDVRQFLAMAGLRLEEGNPAELFGFPEFNSAQIMSNISNYLIGAQYPVLSQCVVARPDAHN